mmetsp:Transcript_24895/g.52109  ORF Transcript_24895/g.52109 Transcript_24895/m.52109 type:complete len:792 (-) Transcript_24895:77-2452(-)
MSTQEGKPVLFFKHLMNRRDFLSRLLFPPNVDNTNKIINPIGFPQNLRFNLHDVDAARLPALELKYLLSALSKECLLPQSFLDVYAWNVDSNESSYTAFSPIDNMGRIESKKIARRKRPDSVIKFSHRRSKRVKRGSNNHHSILRFIERTLESRYHFRHNRNESRDDRQNKFLDGELRSYFSTDDVIFQAEEEILCLAFKIAYDGIVNCFHHASYCHDNTTKSIDESANQSNAPFLKFRDSLPNISTIDETTLHDEFIATALRIIDSIIDYDQKERRAREMLLGTISNRQQQLNFLIADRRFGKEEQLQQPKRNINCRRDASSIIEERYKREYLWLKDLQNRRHGCSLSSQKDPSMKHGTIHDTISGGGVACESNKAINVGPDIVQNFSNSVQSEVDFIVLSGKIDSDDTFCLSGVVDDDEAIDEHDEKLDFSVKMSIYQNEAPKETTDQDSPQATTNSESPSLPLYHDLDNEARELRQTFLDMPLNELSSAQVVLYATESLGNLLRRYCELNGAAGIGRCGDVVVKGLHATGESDVVENDAENLRFPLNDAIISELVKKILTDATGALRAKAFLHSFVLPLMEQMNPIVSDPRAARRGDGKPASRLLSALLATLARDRPIELVESVIFPILTMTKTIQLKEDAHVRSIEPSRFQCELIARLLQGKGALSSTAIALLIELLHPLTSEKQPLHRGMEWNDKTMPLVTACLNRQPILDNRVVARLADAVSHNLTTDLKQLMEKSIKFSNLFHTLVTKYGAQLRATGKIGRLIQAAYTLKTFMSKSITTSLKKL